MFKWPQIIMLDKYYTWCCERIDYVINSLISATVRWLLGPDLQMMHEFRANLPEECTFGMERCFNLTRYTYTLPTMEPFAEWLYHRSRHSIKEMYRYQRKTLQMISYKGTYYLGVRDTLQIIGYKGTYYLCVRNKLRMIGYKGTCYLCVRNTLQMIGHKDTIYSWFVKYPVKGEEWHLCWQCLLS